MQQLCAFLLFAVALVNLAPLVGVVSAARLESLYGVVFDDPDILILMRHRAVLFGIVGGLLVASAIHSPLRPLAFIVGLVSMGSFIGLAWLGGDPNAELRRIVLVDAVALLALVGAAVLHHLSATPR